MLARRRAGGDHPAAGDRGAVGLGGGRGAHQPGLAQDIAGRRLRLAGKVFRDLHGAWTFGDVQDHLGIGIQRCARRRIGADGRPLGDGLVRARVLSSGGGWPPISSCKAADSVREATTGTSTFGGGGAGLVHDAVTATGRRPPRTSSVKTTRVAIHVRRRDFCRAVRSRSGGKPRGSTSAVLARPAALTTARDARARRCACRARSYRPVGASSRRPAPVRRMPRWPAGNRAWGRGHWDPWGPRWRPGREQRRRPGRPAAPAGTPRHPGSGRPGSSAGPWPGHCPAPGTPQGSGCWPAPGSPGHAGTPPRPGCRR